MGARGLGVFALARLRWLGASSLKLCFPFQVAPYINFHFSFLESILQRLDEEENMEIERIMAKFNTERAFILKCLQSKRAAKTETTV